MTRNMHTVSELALDTDVLAACHAVHRTLLLLGEQGFTTDDLKSGHTRLDEAAPFPPQDPVL